MKDRYPFGRMATVKLPGRVRIDGGDTADKGSGNAQLQGIL